MKPQPRTRFVIVRDNDGPEGQLHYFVLTSSRIPWRDSYDPDEAHVFTSRVEASTVLRNTGKHRHGWRVVKEAR